MRYADDIIVGFEKKEEAEDYLRRLPDRLAKFSLRLAEEKSSLVKFNRWEPDDSGRFTLSLLRRVLRFGFADIRVLRTEAVLGFEFYWSRTWKNPRHKIVKRKTCKKK